MKPSISILLLFAWVSLVLAGDTPTSGAFSEMAACTSEISRIESSTGTNPLVLGDVDGDGVLTAADTVLLANYLVENQVNGLDLDNANLTRTGGIDIVDLTALQGILAGYPFCVFTSPKNGERYDGNLIIPVRVEVVSLRTVSKIEVFLNNEFMFSMKNSPWATWNWNLNYAGEGWNETLAVATDSIGQVSIGLLKIWVIVQY